MDWITCTCFIANEDYPPKMIDTEPCLSPNGRYYYDLKAKSPGVERSTLYEGHVNCGILGWVSQC